MNQSPEIDQLCAAIVAAQGKGLVSVAQSKNTQTNSKYANLTDILIDVMPILNSEGLGLTQFVGEIRSEGSIHTAAITTRIIHKSGQWIEQAGNFPLASPPVSKEGKQILNYSQTHGLVLTYGRRYALLSALGIAVGDDKDAQDLQSAMGSGTDVRYDDAPSTSGWEVLTGGAWFAADAPGHAGKTIGELDAEQLKELRGLHFKTNPAVLANIFDEAADILTARNETYKTAAKPGLANEWPADWKDLTPAQVRKLLGWARGLPKEGGAL